MGFPRFLFPQLASHSIHMGAYLGHSLFQLLFSDAEFFAPILEFPSFMNVYLFAILRLANFEIVGHFHEFLV